jgi:beta-galactosidase
MWPVDLEVGGVALRYATAQPLCKLIEPSVYVFFAWPGVAPEFGFELAKGESVKAPYREGHARAGSSRVDRIKPGEQVATRIRTRNGKDTQIVVLSREDARNTWNATLGGRERLILSSADVFFEGNKVHLRSSEPSELKFGIFPGPDHPPRGFTFAGRDGIFELFADHLSRATVTAKVDMLKDADRRAPVSVGQEVAEAPDEGAFEGAARWVIRVPPVESDAVKKVFLRITYEGDVARIYDRGKLVTDDFFKGTPWAIGLTRQRSARPILNSS